MVTSDAYYKCMITKVLDELLKQKYNLPDQNGKVRHFNYMVVHSEKEDGGIIYAIRHPGSTRGNVITNSEGRIEQIILDESFYGKDAYKAVEKYIGCRLNLKGE